MWDQTKRLNESIERMNKAWSELRALGYLTRVAKNYRKIKRLSKELDKEALKG